MVDFCWNTVRFAGERYQDALDYFRQMDRNEVSWLFNIRIEDRDLHFRSKSIPPLRNLIEVAEAFDLNFFLEYQMPEEKLATYQYECLQSQELSPKGEALRKTINAAENRSALGLVETEIKLARSQNTIDTHQLTILVQLISKKYGGINTAQGREKEAGSLQPCQSAEEKQYAGRSR